MTIERSITIAFRFLLHFITVGLSLNFIRSATLKFDHTAKTLMDLFEINLSTYNNQIPAYEVNFIIFTADAVNPVLPLIRKLSDISIYHHSLYWRLNKTEMIRSMAQLINK